MDDCYHSLSYYHPIIIKLSFSLSCYHSIIRHYLVSPSIIVCYHAILAELKIVFYEDDRFYKNFCINYIIIIRMEIIKTKLKCTPIMHRP